MRTLRDSISFGTAKASDTWHVHTGESTPAAHTLLFGVFMGWKLKLSKKDTAGKKAG